MSQKFEAAIAAALEQVGLVEETPENAREWARMVNAFISFARRQPVRRRDPASYRGIKFERRDPPSSDSVSRMYRITVPLGRSAGSVTVYLGQPAVRLDLTDWSKVWTDGHGCPACLRRLSDEKAYADRKKRRSDVE